MYCSPVLIGLLLDTHNNASKVPVVKRRINTANVLVLAIRCNEGTMVLDTSVSAHTGYNMP